MKKSNLSGLLLMSALVFSGAEMNFAPAAETWQPAPGPLKTRWTKEVSPTNALKEYPRPHMTRTNWLNLNGLWNYSLSPDSQTAAPATFGEKIMVPFPYESSLSGVGKASIPNQKLWYKRTFTVPASWKGQRVILHFGAVNYDSEVMVNGTKVGSHRGGFDGFDIDVTSSLKAGENTLVVSALNPLKDATQVLGKQRLRSGGIFYTGATGIWQTVWLEPVPVAHVASLKATPDIDNQRLVLTVESSAPKMVKITALDGNKVIATVNGATGKELIVPVKNPGLWTPDSPKLYRLKVELVNKASDKKALDRVDSYFAMRKISLGKDEQNRTKIFLNNKFLFQVGALDQGYWPDGIYTAPTDEALKYDIEVAKKLGYNMLRKHAKLEPARWYYHADKLGMLVWQDMPQMYGGEADWTPAVKAQWDTEWREELREFHHFPSIVVWTIFNEAWGQHDTELITAWTKKVDPSRLINSVSGWTDKGVGDMHDTHDYRGPGSRTPEANRAAVCGEFGGLALPLKGRRWDESVAIMGYGANIRNPWELTKLYQELLRKGYDLRDQKGTSALVYTQIVDVEQEVNGLVTYDREIIKPDLNIAKAANQGKFLPLPPNPYPSDIVVVPTSEENRLTWSYTTEKPADGWFQPSYDATAWAKAEAPFGNDIGMKHSTWNTSDLWIRREFTLPANVPVGTKLAVFHDEDAEIYINGVLAASPRGYNGGYEYFDITPAARAAMKPGQTNTFAVHVHQTRGGQGVDVGLIVPAPEL